MPDGINIEVTSYCPLNCPQCYCSVSEKKYVDIQRVQSVLAEGVKFGLSHVEFSGGETLCYPYIYDAIDIAKQLGLSTSISISGWGFDQTSFNRLHNAGVDSIHVSINSYTEEKNSLSRDGFKLAIKALQLLNANHYENTIINWVMHSFNADDLPKMIALAEQYNVFSILIIDPKPNSHDELSSYPTKEQLLRVVKVIKENNSSIILEVHHCFSALAALVGDNKLWGNMNRGIYKGCTAGLCSLSLDVNGHFMPCRHLALTEGTESLYKYWKESNVLNLLRSLDNKKKEPCLSCKYSNYCRHCVAINAKLEKELYLGNKYCTLYQSRLS